MTTVNNELEEIRSELIKAIEANGDNLTHKELLDLATRVGSVATLFATALSGIYELWGGHDEFMKVVAEKQAERGSQHEHLKDAEAKQHVEGDDGSE